MKYYEKPNINISTLLGKIITNIEGLNKGNDEVKFILDNGDQYVMWHPQKCCENVEIDDIDGDFTDLLNNPIILAEESNNEEDTQGRKELENESFTWTFYRLATVKGYLTIKWLGESNGYYSERVDFIKI